MEQYQDIVTLIALTLGVGWASGINLYAAVLTLGVLGASGGMELPPDLQVLANPLVIGAAGLMYCTEFFTDKIPGVDSGWDAMHTFIRIPAGALLASGAVGDIGAAWQIAAGLVGGSLAAGAHASKAGTRLMVNTSPEPASNWGLSMLEDAVVFAGIWATVHHPWVMLVVSLLMVGMMIWLLPKLLRAIARLFRRIGARLRGEPAPDLRVPPPADDPARLAGSTPEH